MTVFNMLEADAEDTAHAGEDFFAGSISQSL